MYCSAPFNKLICFNNSTLSRASDVGFLISSCYGSWLNKSIKFPFIKNINKLKDEWINNYQFNLLRHSVEKNINIFCNINNCPLYISKYKEETYNLFYPSTLIYAGSRTCNLRCVTCRPNYIRENFDAELFNLFLSFITPDVKKIKLNCSGEALVNPVILNFFRSELTYSLKEISLITNGLLFTEEMHNSFHKSIKDILKTVSVSVDAVSKAVYEKIRIGGDFNILTKNLNFISQLRKSGLIPKFNLGFVISKYNVSELNSFCEWAKELNVDGLNINRVDDWQRLKQSEFEALTPDWRILDTQLEALKDFETKNININVVTNFRL